MTLKEHVLEPSEILSLVQGLHWDPHHLLGLHPLENGKKAIRLWRPGALELYLEHADTICEARKIDPAGLFELVVDGKTERTDYRIYHQNGLLAHDPYAFESTWGEMDAFFFSKGTHYKLFDVMGAKEIVHQGVRGVRFTLWAPSAKQVSLVGDFNFWDGRVNPMRITGGSGVWELFVPGLEAGERYKFEIKTQSGEIRVKADPYAFASETRPLSASVVAHIDSHPWKDHGWMERRKAEAGLSKPLNIYELHLGSWKMSHGKFLNYRELAFEVASYCKELGFTHVELLPILEHPLDESWGYQVTGYFAVTSRYGTPEDFQFFVDTLHQHEIGVILDWVPGHFPQDDFALARFDGTSLYEHEDPRQGFHPHWNTSIFNYGRVEVSNFLIASALFWAEKMHLDGLRVDAVASMLYLDYGRESGGWIPNPYGGKENLEAIEFLKHLNSVIHERFEGFLMIAEESTSFEGVTRAVQHGGLGFDYKWNMGWMNDTLRYFHKDPLYRSYHHHDLTFGLLYAFSEKFILVLSHDEVVHGKGNLLTKMPGDDWQRFANLRLLYSYMMAQPGKKMLFMSGEFGQWNEWWCKEEIHWYLLQYPLHKGMQTTVKEMNHFYLEHGALWEKDYHHTSFEWIDFSDTKNSVISYKRKGELEELLVIHNFTPSFHEKYVISLPGIEKMGEIFNSDEERYGGSGKKNYAIEILRDSEGKSLGATLVLAPLATQIFKIQY